MSIDISEFDTIDDVDIAFKKALRKAPDEEAEATVRAEWQEAKTSFWQSQAQKQQLAGAKRDALDKYPLAKDFAEDIRGNSPAEIEASAKRFHERAEKYVKDAEAAKAAAEQAQADARQQAQQTYGQPTAAGGGSPSRPAVSNYEADEKYIMDKLAAGDGLQGAKDRLVQQRWQAGRIARGIEAAIQNPSYRSFSRNSPDNTKIQDDRTRRKG
jgi:hypothetical protein